MTSHIRKWKEAKKNEVVKLVEEYPFIAIATLNELPANILSILRKKLCNDSKIIVAKTRVIKKAFEESKVDTTKLDFVVKDSVAIIFSKKNPFELFSFIKKNKGEKSAREGDIAEQDIVIQAGDSGLPPGPALSSLKGVGLKVQVQGPTISITENKIVAKKGDVISAQVADVLSKLNMKPMRIGMQVMGVFDKSEKQFYLANVLDIDEEELFDKFVLAYQQGLNLSVNAGYFNADSTELIVIRAEREAKALSNIVGETKDSIVSDEKTKEEEIVEQLEKSDDDSSEKNVVDEIAEQAVVENKEEKDIESNKSEGA